MRIQEARQSLYEALIPVSPSPREDADRLLMGLLNLSKAQLFSLGDQALTPAQEAQLQVWQTRRQAGEPVAYLTGWQGFWTLDLHVSPATLIPRPETELLVEITLAQLPKKPASVLDLGTGTGAIALALKSERPQDAVTAVDKSLDALQVARKNAARLQLAVDFIESDWFTAVPCQDFDVIVSNPPYIDGSDPHLQVGDVRFEPQSALIAEQAGLADLEKIATEAREYLKSGGWLLLEHGYTQASDVQKILQCLDYQKVDSAHDFQGHMRVTFGQM